MRDTRSSNGTWINGNRLSSKGEKSDRFSLQSHDVIVCSFNFRCLATDSTVRTRNLARDKTGFPLSKLRFLTTRLCELSHSFHRFVFSTNFNILNSCIACKSLPVAINSPLVSSLKRQRTLSEGTHNSAKPALRHRLSVSFSPHVQVPGRNPSGNESDETLMGASRPRSITRDSLVIDDKALPKTPKLERSSSVTSFTTATGATLGGFEAVSIVFLTDFIYIKILSTGKSGVLPARYRRTEPTLWE